MISILYIYLYLIFIFNVIHISLKFVFYKFEIFIIKTELLNKKMTDLEILNSKISYNKIFIFM